MFSGATTRPPSKHRSLFILQPHDPSPGKSKASLPLLGPHTHATQMRIISITTMLGSLPNVAQARGTHSVHNASFQGASKLSCDTCILDYSKYSHLTASSELLDALVYLEFPADHPSKAFLTLDSLYVTIRIILDTKIEI